MASFWSCIYFILSSPTKLIISTVLWKLIEKKFRQLGEFVEGKENLDIVVHRTFNCGMEAIQSDVEEDEEEDSGDENSDGGAFENNRFKRQKTCSYGQLANEDSIQHDIEELAREEEAMLNVGLDDEDDNADTSVDNIINNGSAAVAAPAALSGASRADSGNVTSSKAGQGEAATICLLDDSDEEEENSGNHEKKNVDTVHEKYKPASSRMTVSGFIAEFTSQGGDPRRLRFDNQARFQNLRLYKIHFAGPSFGLLLVPYQGRIVVNFAVKIKENSPEQNGMPFAGDILVSVNGIYVPHNTTLEVATNFMRAQVSSGRTPVELQFAHDPDFSAWFRELLIPSLPSVPDLSSAAATPLPANGVAASPGATVAATAGSASVPSSRARSSGGDEVIELLDDDD